MGVPAVCLLIAAKKFCITITENIWISDFTLAWLSNLPRAVVQNAIETACPVWHHFCHTSFRNRHKANITRHPSTWNKQLFGQGYFASHSCRNFRCFPEVSFDAGNSNNRSGFQTLSIDQNFSASVNEAMTLYTVPISNGEQSSFRQTGWRSLERLATKYRNGSDL